MSDYADLCWENATDALVVSPRYGGRVLSWRHAGQEWVCPPVKLEGGLLRFLFGEERYPGASYIVPHQAAERRADDGGFRIVLRHWWNTPNRFMRDFGWPEKTSHLHLDGLLLEKEIVFDAATSTLVVAMSVRNLTGEVKILTPWLHNNFSRRGTRGFVVHDGRRREYREEDIYWGCHLAGESATIRAVLGDETGGQFAVLGAAADLLKGVYLQRSPADWPDDLFAVSCAELRYHEVALPPGAAWRANAFLAFTSAWERWAEASPVELYARLDLAPAAVAPEPDLCPMLDLWRLPQEREGLMALSFLDKPPFSSAERFGAAHAFAGFHARGAGAQAHVTLYAPEPQEVVRIELRGGSGWALSLDGGQPGPSLQADFTRHDLRRLTLHAPADLAGKDGVAVRIAAGRAAPITLTVPPWTGVEPEYPYQVEPMPAYLEKRWRAQWGGFAGTTADEFRRWQQEHRDRLLRHVRAQISAPAPLEPRLVERQTGPTCVREKVLIQTEPGFWIPAYVVYPIGAQGKMPAIIFYHGSGPGKQNFVGDEDPAFPRAEPTHELEYLPYRLAVELNCLVYAPDLRWLGELAETNPGQFPGRLIAAGVDQQALMAWDYLCQLDYLCSRPDVDAGRIGAYGSSGGGNATGVVAALDDRVGAAIVSSTGLYYLDRRALPTEEFFRHMQYRHPSTAPLAEGSPIGGADLLLLAAPRPLWITDGIDDVAASARVEETEELRDRWFRNACASREAIAEGYRLLGAEDRCQATWFDGGHCAGMTLENVAGWFRRWLC